MNANLGDDQVMIPRQQGNARGGRDRADPFSDPFFGGGGGDAFAGMNQMMSQMDTMFGGGGDVRRSGARRVPGGRGLMAGGSMLGNMDQMMMSSQGGGGGGTMSSSSYSYTSSGGPDGQTYQRTTQSTMGPGGVAETHETEKDSRTGQQKVLVERRIGDRSRTIVRERRRDGTETKLDTLNNLTQEQASQFDTEFQQSKVNTQNVLGGGVPSGFGRRRGGGAGGGGGGGGESPFTLGAPQALVSRQQQQQQQQSGSPGRQSSMRYNPTGRPF